MPEDIDEEIKKYTTKLLGKSHPKHNKRQRKHITWKATTTFIFDPKSTPSTRYTTTPSSGTTPSSKSLHTDTPIGLAPVLVHDNSVNTTRFHDTPVNTNPSHTDHSLKTALETTTSSTAHQANNTPWWPKHVSSIISNIILFDERPDPPLFMFELTEEAANKNFCVLKRFEMNLETAIDAQQNSPVGYGSEFRPIHILKPLLQHHPYWNHIQRLLSKGSDWPLSPIDEQQRQVDLKEAIAFGNHKGAETNTSLLTTLIEDDVTHGHLLPLPLGKIHRIPGAIISPMNIIQQDTIDESGNTIPKYRLTHDQSFVMSGSNSSVNSRLDKSKLAPCIFGWVTRRLLNWIVAARRKHPTRRILATKVDFKAAYRRCHLHHRTAVQSCSQLPDRQIALLALRLTFGGAACPFEWSIISEMICDLCTEITHDDNWDPDTLKSPSQHLVPPPSFLPDDIPFEEGKELAINLNVSDKGTHKMYLDDIIGLCIDLPDTSNIKRSQAAPLLAIHSCSRPIHDQEPLPRDPMESTNKLKAESNLSEVKIILGWRWDLRSLIISLPVNKFIAWTATIVDMIKTQQTKTTALESTIGRLSHLALILPFVHHFLSRIRELHTMAKRRNRQNITIPPSCLDDLHLFLFLLQKAKDGINMNILVYRKPTHVYRSDSCPAGLGGYSADGHAWRFYLPPNLLSRASNNLLEHLAAVITPWIDIINGRIQPNDCALSMTDSTTSAGWLRKSNFREEIDPLQASIRITVAREHARRYMNLGIQDFSQWFPGKENNVADSLS